MNGGGISMSIADNILLISRNVEAAIGRRKQKGFEVSPVKLVAVTKNQNIAAIRAAVAAGVEAIGENRVQEAAGKQPEIISKAEWHLIGHLQTNKTRQAVSLFDLIHSVDSERLAMELDKAAYKMNKRQRILIQVNVAGEETKFGIDPGQVFRLAETISNSRNLVLCGLMTIAPHYEDPEEARPVFRELYRMFEQLRTSQLPHSDIKWLSMGMTNDYQVAVEEGANLVRIGTAIFGSRQY
jgi:pyridoxal phosphate enzyme (YggS family)